MEIWRLDSWTSSTGKSGVRILDTGFLGKFACQNLGVIRGVLEELRRIMIELSQSVGVYPEACYLRVVAQ